jgi:hypothetical protein
MVENVECLEANPQIDPFPDRNLFVQRRVEIPPGRLPQDTHSDISERWNCRAGGGQRKSGGVEVAVEALGEILRVGDRLAPDTCDVARMQVGFTGAPVVIIPTPESCQLPSTALAIFDEIPDVGIV